MKRSALVRVVRRFERCGAGLVSGVIALVALSAATPSVAAITFSQADVDSSSNGQIVGKSGGSLNGSGYDATADMSDASLDAETGALSDVARYKGAIEASLSASETATAKLTTPTSATFEFSGVQTVVNASAQEAYLGGSDQGDYGFQSTGPSILTLSYALTDVNPAGGLEYQIVDQTTNSVFDDTTIAANSTGSRSFDLAPGSYLVAFNDDVQPFIDLTSQGSGSSSHDDLISLAVASPVSAAPEPTTWALLLCGVSMVGAFIRRRQTPAAFAGV